MIDSQKFLLTSVNILLSSINELSISDDVELADILEAQKASDVLEEVKKSVLSQEWDFNTDTDWEFVPDIDGYISIPANVLDIASNDNDIVMRDWRLYSKSGKTAKFTSAIKCTVVWDMDFNSLTHALRHYITIRASRIFQYRMIGDQAQYKFSEEDEHHAYISARRSDGRTANYNMLTSAYGIDIDVRG